MDNMILEIVCHRSNETFRILCVSLSPIPLTAHQITINDIIQHSKKYFLRIDCYEGYSPSEPCHAEV